MKISFIFSKIADMNKHVYILIITLLICGCSNEKDFIQDVYVNEIIDLNLPIYSELNTAGNSMFLEGGIEGIIIYKGIGREYKIYDRKCSYEPSLTCSRIDSVYSGIAWCKCCPSAFDINNSGDPINAPALLPLKKYQWSLDDNNILRIFNY